MNYRVFCHLKYLCCFIYFVYYAAKVIKNLVTSKFFSKKMDLFLFVVKLEPKTSDLGENGIEKTQFLA